jgi:hypothetical protein
MLETLTHWQLNVQRGPDWLFVQLVPPEQPGLANDADGVAEQVWEVVQQHFCYRVVIELDRVGLLYSSLLGQLILLSKRIYSHQGILRMSGVSENNLDVLRTCRLEAALPSYHNRGDAVMGHNLRKPR